MGGFAHRLRRVLLALVPLVTALALALLVVVPPYVPHVGQVMPLLGVAAVFYWTVYRPDLMSYGAAFAVGVIADLAIGTPPGASALALVIVRRLALAQRRFFIGKPFHVLWAGFLLAAVLAAGVLWLTACLYLVAVLQIWPAIVQAAITVALFPAVAWLLARCQALLHVPRGIVAPRA